MLGAGYRCDDKTAIPCPASDANGGRFSREFELDLAELDTAVPGLQPKTVTRSAYSAVEDSSDELVVSESLGSFFLVFRFIFGRAFGLDMTRLEHALRIEFPLDDGFRPVFEGVGHHVLSDVTDLQVFALV